MARFIKLPDGTRDRSKPRTGTERAYRSNLNGPDADGAEKIRWALDIQAGDP